MSSWRLAIRLARRDALRARGRSILVLVMIALPVLAVTAADVVIQTQEVTGVEALDRRLGTADAQVTVPAEGRPMVQRFDPMDGATTVGGKPDPPTEAEISAALGGARLVEERVGSVSYATDKGIGYVEVTEVDLRDPVADGLFELTSGRLPETAGEVVVNDAVLDSGYALGDTLDLGRQNPAPTIVGIADSASLRTAPTAAGPIGSLGLDARNGASPGWLAEGGPVSWDAVEALNTMGALVLSRAVIEDPPPASEIPEELNWDSGDDSMVAAVALIVVMALLEVVLLAGPAFAVTARRQARSLALMSATGGTPAQSRRVVLAGGLVLGGAAAVLGVVLGIGAGWLLLPVVQRWSSHWFGPFDVPWPHVAGIAMFGLASAVLAAVVPAWIAARQDVVAVLAGRRADRPPSVRSPILGVVLLGIGVAMAAYGAAAGSGSGEFLIAGSAIVAVLGMILVVPVVVAGVARAAGRLPLSTRYAARDAARHRTRTVPAIAAVAATVAGVVTLGIGLSSDEAENEGTYTPSLAMGQAAVTGYDLRPAAWDELARVVDRELPGATVTPMTGVGGEDWVDLQEPGGSAPLLDEMSVGFGSSMLVGRSVPDLVPGIAAADRERAAAVLADGGVVAFTDHDVAGDEIELMAGERGTTIRVPAAYVRFQDDTYPTLAAVASPEAVERLGVDVGTVAVAVAGADVSTEQEQDVTEAVAAVNPNAGFYVERGYQAEENTRIVQFVLAALGAILMLGGTLTATFLALSDARPDLATLSAVGASPRRRRSIAASYALVVGFVGALLGAAVGFIPGIAITYPLTAPAYTDTGPYLDVPWALIVGLVVGLPLLTAAIVGLCTRARLPMVARLD
ncbi:ABC transporter permease [Nocardioides sp. SR21]|uniref:ABC transporter permease n=1 Tax=Nocardioides sp. SR21 TaxID=2919501 RepID=UPI001FAA4CD7|nr:ABC transporter permease [Nocardioides sp. SR21]